MWTPSSRSNTTRTAHSRHRTRLATGGYRWGCRLGHWRLRTGRNLRIQYSRSPRLQLLNGGSEAVDADTDGEASQVYVATSAGSDNVGVFDHPFNVQTWGDVNPDTFALEMCYGGASCATSPTTRPRILPAHGATSHGAHNRLGGRWNVGILLDSDVSGATEGFHVDDRVMFGVQRWIIHARTRM